MSAGILRFIRFMTLPGLVNSQLRSSSFGCASIDVVFRGN